MPFHARYFNLTIAIIIGILSTIALAINCFAYHFPGNNYFPHEMPMMGIILTLALMGTYLLFGAKSSFFKIARELVYFFLVISVITIATIAAQFTPFDPIDKKLIATDQTFFIHLQALMKWAANIAWFRTLLALGYNSLPFQMIYLPIIIIFACKFNYIHEYYSMLLLTTLFGFTFYYFFPTMGPASFISSPYFMTEQYATGVKFTELHHYIPPSTLDGGMIAMPSFHVIWAWLCLALVRCWPILFALLVPINVLLIASCVLLGWHYFVDLIGSTVLLLLAYAIYFSFVKKYQSN